MNEGAIKGLFCFGQNPAVGGPNCDKEREALAKLDWLVAVDIFETDTAAFWKRPGVDPAKINTEVFLLPAAASVEKEGSVVNSGRWAQWRYKAADPPGQAKSDAWIVTRLIQEMQCRLRTRGADAAAAVVSPENEKIQRLLTRIGYQDRPYRILSRKI